EPVVLKDSRRRQCAWVDSNLVDRAGVVVRPRRAADIEWRRLIDQRGASREARLLQSIDVELECTVVVSSNDMVPLISDNLRRSWFERGSGVRVASPLKLAALNLYEGPTLTDDVVRV